MLTGEALAWMCNFLSTPIHIIDEMLLSDLEWWYLQAKSASEKMYKSS